MMKVETAQLTAILLPTQALQGEIKDLETQMQGLDPGSPEYQYDQLVLEKEQMTLRIREEHPELDPLTLAGDRALGQLLGQDPQYRAIEQAIKDLIRAHPSESTSWGIPMDWTGAKFVAVDR